MPKSKRYIEYEKRQIKLARLVMKYENDKHRFKKLIDFFGASQIVDTIEYWDNRSQLIADIKNRLQQIKKDQGLDQSDMAIRLSRKYASYVSLESKAIGNKHAIKLRDLKAFIHDFGVSYYWLLTGEESIYNQFSMSVMMMGYDFKLSFGNMFALQMYAALPLKFRKIIDKIIYTIYELVIKGPMHKNLLKSKKDGVNIDKENYVTEMDEYDENMYDKLNKKNKHIDYYEKMQDMIAHGFNLDKVD